MRVIANLTAAQEFLIHQLMRGHELWHSASSGQFELRREALVSTVYPSTVNSLIRRGIVRQLEHGACVLAAAVR